MFGDAPTMDSLGKKYGTFDGWGMSAGEVEVLLVVSGLDVDRSAKALLDNMYVSNNKGDMGREDGPGKLDRVATVEVFEEKEKGIMAMRGNGKGKWSR